jgi:hypothetical protein
MTQTFTIKRGDTSPSLLWELEDTETNLVAATVLFNMKRKRDGVVILYD